MLAVDGQCWQYIDNMFSVAFEQTNVGVTASVRLLLNGIYVSSAKLDTRLASASCVNCTKVIAVSTLASHGRRERHCPCRTKLSKFGPQV